MKLKLSIFLTVLFALAGFQSFSQANKMTIEPLVETNQFPNARKSFAESSLSPKSIISIYS